MTVLTVGVANVRSRRAPRATDYMRIASIAKAFSGAVAFALIRRGRVGLGDTVGRWVPGLPRAWGRVTLRQLLNHTSGLPDYTQSAGFHKQFETDPGGFVSPGKIISWVAQERVVFPPGARYEYSNTDNIVIGLIAERATGRPYGALLRHLVFRPLGLRRTSFPSFAALPNPFIRGYLSRRLVPARLQRDQLRFIPGGASSPPGPGANAAGLAIFRYRTRCGTV